ncbi:MAG: hypothetical protein E3K32_12395 [wastewater metagenome]|nr:hypothetical protein [Candidatus Loosdrechtia aerotolerans]
MFTKELEVALADRRIDIAVHSAKDVPTVLHNKLTIGAQHLSVKTLMMSLFATTMPAWRN